MTPEQEAEYFRDIGKTTRAMTETNEELKPCPFCGSTKLKKDFVSNTGCNVHYIWCMSCNAKGPWFGSGHPSNRWNERPIQPAAQEKLLRAIVDIWDDGPDGDHYRSGALREAIEEARQFLIPKD